MLLTVLIRWMNLSAWVCLTDVCDTEFTNPYGFCSSSHVNSEASSDRLSEFGTAPAFHDVGMQTDLYWYEGRHEGCFMTPCFKGSADFRN